MKDFVIITSAIGGILIGLSSALLLWGNGQVAGISGIIGRVLRRDDVCWRIAFLIAMGVGGISYLHMMDFNPIASLTSNYFLLIIAGGLVGFGTRLGNGCTSGHGICGLSRLSYRSLIAVIVFMVSASAVVFFMRHFF